MNVFSQWNMKMQSLISDFSSIQEARGAIDTALNSFDREIENFDENFKSDSKFKIKDVYSSLDDFTDLTEVSIYPYIIQVKNIQINNHINKNFYLRHY